MDSERIYPSTYEGEALTALGLDADDLASVDRVRVLSAALMVVELPGQRLQLQLVRIARGGWEMEVWHTFDPIGPLMQIGVPQIGAEKPAWPDGRLIAAALRLLQASDVHTKPLNRQAAVAVALWRWMAGEGTLPSPAFTYAITSGKALVTCNTVGSDDELTLVIRVAHGSGPDLSDLID